MDLPKSIRILGDDWSITSPNIELNARGRFGETVSTDQSIRIDNSSPKSIQRETLLHESLHAINASVLDVDKHLSEEQVKTVAKVLLLMFRENPRFVDFILEGADASKVREAEALSRSRITEEAGREAKQNGHDREATERLREETRQEA